MSEQRKGGGITWTDTTWNPVRGCSRVSQGCVNCYAEQMAARFCGSGQPYEGLARSTASGPRWTGKVRLVGEHMLDPLRWQRPRRVFVNSMADLFHEALTDEQIDRIFAVMALARRHRFQVLTKRPERMRRYFGALERRARAVMAEIAFLGGDEGALELPLPHVWLGVSVEDQATANERVPLLLATPAALRWVSAEPLLGPVDLTAIAGTKLDGIEMAPPLGWVVVGGESGRGARPMHPAWARSLRDQCAAAKVPFFFKQWGEWAPEGLVYGEECHKFDLGTTVWRVGRKAAGHLLDGVQHWEFPA